jgi:septal ring factor EnvC (AmiA/AmiB activator)
MAYSLRSPERVYDTGDIEKVVSDAFSQMEGRIEELEAELKEANQRNVELEEEIDSLKSRIEELEQQLEI